MRDLNKVLRSEMTEDEWNRFRDGWIAQHRKDLVTECGLSKDDAFIERFAEILWENYIKQDGWIKRDELISMARKVMK